MRVNGRDIGPGYQPYIIGEVSGEHRGSKDRALDLILAIKEAGADAAKLQLFDPVKLAVARGGKHKVLTEGLWKGRTLLDLYIETFTPRSWFPDLFAYAREIGITLFSSVFDEEGVDYLETLGCPTYKVSSFSVTDLALIRKAASTGKPLIISTGMAGHEEIVEAINATVRIGKDGWSCKELCEVALLHCVSSYPCKIEDANLTRILALREDTSPVIGLSDHTLGTTAAIVATALGASIIEKHITLDRNSGGPDAAFSLEPAEFAKLVQDVKDAHASLGAGNRPQSESIYRDLRHKGSQ
jgi:sialic acid synthase SpsE